MANSFARYICFTLNNPTEHDIEKVCKTLEEKTTYAVFGEETGEGGTEHLQGYMELPAKPRARMSTVKGWFAPLGIYLERRAGTAKQAADYCKKGSQSHIEWDLDGCDGIHFGQDAMCWEHGELSEPPTPGKRNDIEKVRDAMLSGDIKNEFDLLMQVRSMQALRFGQQFLNNMPVDPIRERPLVYWIYGPTGTGKSLGCADIVRRLVDKRGWSFWRSNGTPKWFDGYNRQEIVWFDDFRFQGGTSDFAYMLNLLDVYPLRVPIKGGFVTWTPRVILFTAPTNVQDAFSCISEREDVGQLERRVSKSFDFGDGGSADLAVSIWSFMNDPDKHHAPVQKWGEIKMMDSDSDDEAYDADDSLSTVTEEYEVDHDGLVSEYEYDADDDFE